MAKGPGGLAIVLDEPQEHGGEHDEEGMSSDEHEQAKKDAVDELIDCIKSGDREGAHAAFAAAHKLHSEDESEPEMPEDGDDEEDGDDGDIHLDD